MEEDPVISRIREVRHQISEECEHDPRKLVNYYRDLQRKHVERMLRSEDQKDETAEDLVNA